MVLLRRTFGLTLVAAFAALTLGSTAQAAPIVVNDFGGVVGFASVSKSGGTFSVNNLNAATFTTLVNGAPIVGPPLPTNLNNLVFNTTPTATIGATSYYSLAVAGFAQVNPAGGASNFALTNLVAAVTGNALVITLAPNTATLLTNGTPGYDFSKFFNPGGQFTFTLNANMDLNSFIGGGPASAPDPNGTASFGFLAAAPDASVPEPASLAVFGLMTLAGGVIARRKLKHRTVAHA